MHSTVPVSRLPKSCWMLQQAGLISQINPVAQANQVGNHLRNDGIDSPANPMYSSLSG